MPVSAETLELLRTETRPPDLDLSWLKPGTEWGMKASTGRKGLTIELAEQGSYGDVPELSSNFTARPRGAAARPEAPRLGQKWTTKSESWSASVQMLYEEAQARQWSS